MTIKRRNKIDISVEILNAALGGANKTQIVYNANLNFSIANKYIDLLKNKNLIRQDGDLYMTTEKGKSFSELAKQLKL